MKESQQVEWKESWRDDYLRWICGFANAEGGRLHIGRNERGVVVGVPNAARLMGEIPNKVRDLLGIVVGVDLHEEGGREWLEIVVEPHPNPISYRGEYHVRSGSTKQELKGAALDRFLLRRYGRTWDGVPVPGLAARQLSRAAFASFRKLARESRRLDAAALREKAEGLLEKLNLVEGRYLKRAAALLFHGDPERFVGGAFVKIGYFRSEADLLYHDEVRGDLFAQARGTLDLLVTKYLKALISYSGLQRIESLPVPAEALREALLNALIHKDYSTPAPVQIRVYADKLKMWNPAELPPGWTAGKLLRAHPSCPFNPLVAATFFRAGEIEAWGRGIERILDACRDAGTPAPVIQYEHRDFWFEFPFGRAYTEAVLGGGTTQDTTQETTQEHARMGTDSRRQESIIAALRAEPTLTRRVLAERIGLTPDGVKYHLAKLTAAGRLRHTGSTKAGRWEVLA